MIVANLIRQTQARFEQAGLATPDLDARFLIEDILGRMDENALLSAEQSAMAEAAILRRLSGEPVSRIAGFREFWGRRFYLSPETLDPRPDTETLIESVLRREWNAPRILDLGTGSGCILLTLLHEIRGSSGIGSDVAKGALATAMRNAAEQNLSDRCTFIESNWLEKIEGRFDLIVSNPPYIPNAAIPTLSAEVKNHDPILALDGGDDGLDPYKILLPHLKKFLEPGGVVFFELGLGQLSDLERLVRDSDATLSRTHHDLGGVARVVEIEYGDN